MTKVIILHGWSNGDISDIPEFFSNSEANWMGWTKKELEKKGYQVTNPFLRHGYKSEYKDWKKEIEKLDIDENTILVGWSSGGAFWVRWLGETKQKIKKLILVAPARVVGQSDKMLEDIKNQEIDPEWRDIWDRFHDFESDPTIKDRVKDGVTIFISNDQPWLVEAAKLYTKDFDAKQIEIENQCHFENHRRPSPEFPELLNEILNKIVSDGVGYK